MRLQHVVSGVRCIPSAIIYHAYIDCRTDLPVNGHNIMKDTWSCVSRLSLTYISKFAHSLYRTYRHVTAPLDHQRAPNSGGAHFQSATRTSVHQTV